MNMTNIAELYHSGNCIHFSYRGRKSNKTSNEVKLLNIKKGGKSSVQFHFPQIR